MKMTQRSFLACVILSAALLGIGFALEQRYLPSLITLCLGPAWWYGHFRQLEWTDTAIMVFLFLAAVAELISNAPVWMVLPGIVFTLSGWDLGNFDIRLRKVPATPETRMLEKQHILRLAEVNGLGLLMASLVLLVQIELSLGMAVLLALLAVIGLNQVFKILKSL